MLPCLLDFKGLSLHITPKNEASSGDNSIDVIQYRATKNVHLFITYVQSLTQCCFEQYKSYLPYSFGAPYLLNKIKMPELVVYPFQQLKRYSHIQVQ